MALSEEEKQRRRKVRAIKKLLEDDAHLVLEALLEHPFWPEQIRPDELYSRMEDDTQGKLMIVFAQDGDGHVRIETTEDPEDPTYARRFRSGFGGGRSERVLSALRFLAVAIVLDNRDYPQRRRSSAEEAG
jgi:hypothetical protein